MSNHLFDALIQWDQQRDTLQWVLATVIETEGSSYRKAGAMMLLNDMGKHHGLLSGGCLEADIIRQSRQCWDTDTSRIIEYDMRDEDDPAWQLGIGCGGRVRILLQPVNAATDYLQLGQVISALHQRQTVQYAVSCDVDDGHNRIVTDANPGDVRMQLFTLTPPTGLLIMGAGIDALPLVNLAADLGWHVSVADPRTSHARPAVFHRARHHLREPYAGLDHALLKGMDAVVVMHHHIQLDADALVWLADAGATDVRYTGLLGPRHRTERVLQRAGLNESSFDVFANPMGLSLGGELPEHIALSTLAEIQAVLHGRTARSISLALGD
ncbi:XdhC family protein [Aestuariibacter halophilus]|uniref:XdhC family protein n=1 Tax=Fluctibacter halophilus TaxID=226011 RepID=A0ABS8G4W7_9ALTE|nr:XdhC family protein [Aestuariibacter halophilus]MCC2615617.1 XdhC family protein [Aestuariibacter halophilus]